MVDVLVREVGLREGLQIIPDIVPTERKIDWIGRLVRAGFTEIEVTSLVPPKYLPQFADAEAVVAAARAISGLCVSALVPNLAGARRALSHGLAHMTVITAATEGFSAANLRCTRAESIEAFRALVATVRQAEGPQPRIAAGISAAFGCSLEGRVAAGEVLRMVDALLAAGADEIILADTIGAANPAQVRALMTEVIARAGTAAVTLHLHDTLGFGLANVVAALDAGVRRFDASIGGVGGCPNSPGSTGNIASEDLAVMLEAMGLSTGLDCDGLLAIAADIEQSLPQANCHGAIRRAGARVLPIFLQEKARR